MSETNIQRMATNTMVSRSNTELARQLAGNRGFKFGSCEEGVVWDEAIYDESGKKIASSIEELAMAAEELGWFIGEESDQIRGIRWAKIPDSPSEVAKILRERSGSGL